MQLTIRLLIVPILLLSSYSIVAQTSIENLQFTTVDKSCKPPKNRELWHDKVDKEQKAALRLDGKSDQLYAGTADENVNFYVTQALVQKVDAIQCSIEKDTAIIHQKKVAYITGLEKVLKGFNTSYRNRTINASAAPKLIEAFEKAMHIDKAGGSIEQIVEKNSYEVGNILVSSGAFDQNTSIKPSKNILLRKYAHLYPDRIFYMLKENSDVPFRDSLILVAAYKYPRQLYDYSAANNRLGFAIRQIDDPLVKAVVRMAKSPSGQLYFPFLDNIMKGNQTIEEIDAAKDDEVKYYKLLVKTRIDYVNRSLQKEKIMEMESLNWWLNKKANDVFIKTINALHNEPDNVRFRILQQLSPQELYYLAVYGGGEIYTSSYTKGVYPLLMQKIGGRSDSLLMSVSFDKFKKFIRLAAGFNTLSHFLNSFPDAGQAERLMTAFVNNLERSDGLEDGVDVADSYASISETIKPLAAKMLENVQANYEKNVKQNNKRGMVIYDLLYKLFISADSTKSIDLSKEFGIPPVYNISYNALADEKEQIIMQMFFYGDKDGQNDYNSYLRQFPAGSWKMTHEKQWVAISSTKGKSVTIYANKPLPEETGEDEKAQAALDEYLKKNNIQPTIVIHRGHSYYAPYTIKYIQPSAKIVFLGSCGGYHLIHDVLSHAPDAHIIASKQIGKTVINQPFFTLLNDKLTSGKSIDWIPFWSEFKAVAGKQEGFEDYIPPHKNLGAIFIKAYRSQMGDESNTLSMN